MKNGPGLLGPFILLGCEVQSLKHTFWVNDSGLNQDWHVRLSSKALRADLPGSTWPAPSAVP